MWHMDEPEEPLANETDDGDSQARNEPFPMPEGSAITVERFPDGLTINIPPAGLWGGSRGFFSFALIWNGIMLAITAVLVLAMLRGNGKQEKIAWAAPAFMSLFWLVGIGMLLGAINMGRRRAAIAVTGGTLLVIQTGLLGSRQRDWEPGDVEAVRAGPSGMTVNDEPVLELQIFDGGASKFGLLAGRSDEELEWLASELRVALNVPEHAT